MKYCSQCGTANEDNYKYCGSCGKANDTQIINDRPDSFFNIISFFLPLLGLILYIINYEKYPIKANAIGKFSLIGLCVQFIIGILLTCLILFVLFRFGFWFIKL
jgi:hypothetical protein